MITVLYQMLRDISKNEQGMAQNNYQLLYNNNDGNDNEQIIINIREEEWIIKDW